MSTRKSSSDGGSSRCSVQEREAESLERERSGSGGSGGSLRGRKKSGSRGRETYPVVYRNRNRNQPLGRSSSGRARRRSAPPDTYNTKVGGIIVLFAVLGFNYYQADNYIRATRSASNYNYK